MTKRPRLSLAEWRRLHKPGLPLKVLWDPEVTRFVDSRLVTMSFEALARACLERFGKPRAPGRAAIGRYWIDFHRGGQPRPKRQPRKKSKGGC